MPKVLLVANTGWYLYNFRLALARRLRREGVDVVLVCPSDSYVIRLQAEGFRWVQWTMRPGSRALWLELRAMIHLWRIYRTEQPTLVHHFTAKCVLYGSLAASLAGVRRVVNAVTGLGHLFSRPWAMRPARIVWARAWTIFQNPDDQHDFEAAGLVRRDRSCIIRGSGVDAERFSPGPGTDGTPPVVLMGSRLIRMKGVVDFVDAARLLRDRGHDVRFRLAGGEEPDSPSAIPRRTLDGWRREGVVLLLGHVDAIEDELRGATLVVLPSHREGTPRILLEAAAMGKAIVATDVPGCREVVVHGVNGLLVPSQDPPALAAAIEDLLGDPGRRQRMGSAGRQRMLHDFSETAVLDATMAVYRQAGLE